MATKSNEFGMMFSILMYCLGTLKHDKNGNNRNDNKALEKTLKALPDGLSIQDISYADIARFKSGEVPSPGSIRPLAKIGVQVCLLGEGWLQRFLHAAAYTDPEMLISWLFPSDSSPRPKPSSNIPNPLHYQFVERPQPWNNLIEELKSGSALVVVWGRGGTGKSCLVREFADRSSKGMPNVPAFDAYVWVSDADHKGTTTLNIVLSTIAHTLGAEGFDGFTYERKKAEVENLLHTRQVLLIIDNFETISDRALLDWLLQLPRPSRGIITTREKLPEFDTIITTREQRPWTANISLVPLSGMNDVEVSSYVRQRLKFHHIDDLVNDIREVQPLIDITHRNPLALQFAFGLVADQQLTIQEAVDVIAAGTGPYYKNMFTHSWESLDEPVHRVLMAASLFFTGASAPALAEVADVSETFLHPTLTRLVNMTLLILDRQQKRLGRESTRYLLEQPVRSFVETKLVEDDTHAFEKKARLNWAKYYKRWAAAQLKQEHFTQRYWDCLASDQSLIQIEPEWQNLRAGLVWMMNDQHTPNDQRDRDFVDLVIILVHYMDRRGLIWDRLDFVASAIAKALILSEKADHEALQRREDAALLIVDGRGFTLLVANRPDEAIAEITKGLQLAQEIAASSATARETVALAYSFLGGAYLLKGDNETAAAMIEQAKDIAIQCGAVIRNRYRSVAGDLAYEQGDFERAIQFYSAALTDAKQYSGDVDLEFGYRLGFAYLARSLQKGDALARQQDRELARVEFERVIGTNDPGFTIEATYAKLGKAYIERMNNAYKSSELELARRDLFRKHPDHRLLSNIDAFLKGSGNIQRLWGPPS